MTEKLLQVNHLKKYYSAYSGLFSKRKAEIKAVDDITFYINKGETLGFVGESGCGKSTTGRMLMRLIEPTSGSIIFENTELTGLSKKEIRKTRQNIQMIFQDPYASLDPRKTVEKILEEPLIVHKIGTKESRKQRVQEMIKIVGLDSYHAKRYPHQFSGGQRQRIGIARALMTNPKLIIADEPVSALDVSIQAQVINLMKDLQNKLGLTYLFIAHDLGVVKHISDRIAVMYLGHIVELGPSEELYANPLHPYTKALLSSIPIPDPDYQNENNPIVIGDIPSASNPPSGCPFHTRCPNKLEQCSKKRPEFIEVSKGHFVSCYLYGSNQI